MMKLKIFQLKKSNFCVTDRPNGDPEYQLFPDFLFKKRVCIKNEEFCI